MSSGSGRDFEDVGLTFEDGAGMEKPCTDDVGRPFPLLDLEKLDVPAEAGRRSDAHDFLAGNAEDFAAGDWLICSNGDCQVAEGVSSGCKRSAAMVGSVCWSVHSDIALVA